MHETQTHLIATHNTKHIEIDQFNRTLRVCVSASLSDGKCMSFHVLYLFKNFFFYFFFLFSLLVGMTENTGYSTFYTFVRDSQSNKRKDGQTHTYILSVISLTCSGNCCWLVFITGFLISILFFFATFIKY